MNQSVFQWYPPWERSGSVVECLTRDRGAAGSSLIGVTALCPWARTLILAYKVVQPRKTRPFITERLLMGHNQIKQTKQRYPPLFMFWSHVILRHALGFIKQGDNWLLTQCILDILCFCCCLLTFFQNNFFLKLFQEHHHLVNRFVKVIRPNEKMCVFRVTGLKILGRVGPHIFFFWKKIEFYAFWKAFRLSKCIKFYFFQKTWKNSRFHQ